MKVNYILIQTAMPRHGNLGRTEEAWYVVEDGTVTLTDQDGVPLAKGRLQEQWQAKVKEGEDPKQIAARLLYSKVRADKSKSDFNRPLHYPAVRRI